MFFILFFLLMALAMERFPMVQQMCLKLGKPLRETTHRFFNPNDSALQRGVFLLALLGPYLLPCVAHFLCHLPHLFHGGAAIFSGGAFSLGGRAVLLRRVVLGRYGFPPVFSLLALLCGMHGGHPFNAGHPASSITCREGLTMLPWHGQRVDL